MKARELQVALAKLLGYTLGAPQTGKIPPHTMMDGIPVVHVYLERCELGDLVLGIASPDPMCKDG